MSGKLPLITSIATRAPGRATPPAYNAHRPAASSMAAQHSTRKREKISPGGKVVCETRRFSRELAGYRLRARQTQYAGGVGKPRQDSIKACHLAGLWDHPSRAIRLTLHSTQTRTIAGSRAWGSSPNKCPAMSRPSLRSSYGRTV